MEENTKKLVDIDSNLDFEDNYKNICNLSDTIKIEVDKEEMVVCPISLEMLKTKEKIQEEQKVAEKKDQKVIKMSNNEDRLDICYTCKYRSGCSACNDPFEECVFK